VLALTGFVVLNVVLVQSFQVAEFEVVAFTGLVLVVEDEEVSQFSHPSLATCLALWRCICSAWPAAETEISAAPAAAIATAFILMNVFVILNLLLVVDLMILLGVTGWLSTPRSIAVDWFLEKNARETSGAVVGKIHWIRTKIAKLPGSLNWPSAEPYQRKEREGKERLRRKAAGRWDDSTATVGTSTAEAGGWEVDGAWAPALANLV
jgi:hypothetical protein